MACFALIESLRPASCCTVEVVKGGLGVRAPGLASTETTTASPDASSAAASAVACDSVRTTTAFFSWPARAPDALAWSSVALLGLLSTGLGYVLFFRLLARVGPARAITVTFLVPVFGMLWGALFLDEAITANMVAGAVTILAGTALTTGLVAPLRRFERPRAS